jgi:hypothetical protein
MKTKTIGLVTAELMVMYWHDVTIRNDVWQAPIPVERLVDIGREMKIHSVSDEDAENYDFLINTLLNLMVYGDMPVVDPA